MIVSNEFDDDKCDALTGKFIALADKDESLTHREILTAHVGVIGDTLASISCKGCRKASARFVKLLLRDAARDALDFAAKNYGGQPPTSDHVH